MMMARTIALFIFIAITLTAFIDAQQKQVRPLSLPDFVADLLEAESRKASYRYGYNVSPGSKNSDSAEFSHTQKVEDGQVRGEYRILLPDNRWQIVSYTADDRGYRATVRYEEKNGQSAITDERHYTNIGGSGSPSSYSPTGRPYAQEENVNKHPSGWKPLARPITKEQQGPDRHHPDRFEQTRRPPHQQHYSAQQESEEEPPIVIHHPVAKPRYPPVAPQAPPDDTEYLKPLYPHPSHERTPYYHPVPEHLSQKPPERTKKPHVGYPEGGSHPLSGLAPSSPRPDRYEEERPSRPEEYRRPETSRPQQRPPPEASNGWRNKPDFRRPNVDDVVPILLTPYRDPNETPRKIKPDEGPRYNPHPSEYSRPAEPPKRNPPEETAIHHRPQPIKYTYVPLPEAKPAERPTKYESDPRPHHQPPEAPKRYRPRPEEADEQPAYEPPVAQKAKPHPPKYSIPSYHPEAPVRVNSKPKPVEEEDYTIPDAAPAIKKPKPSTAIHPEAPPVRAKPKPDREEPTRNPYAAPEAHPVRAKPKPDREEPSKDSYPAPEAPVRQAKPQQLERPKYTTNKPRPEAPVRTKSKPVEEEVSTGQESYAAPAKTQPERPKYVNKPRPEPAARPKPKPEEEEAPPRPERPKYTNIVRPEGSKKKTKTPAGDLPSVLLQTFQYVKPQAEEEEAEVASTTTKKPVVTKGLPAKIPKGSKKTPGDPYGTRTHPLRRPESDEVLLAIQHQDDDDEIELDQLFRPSSSPDDNTRVVIRVPGSETEDYVLIEEIDEEPPVVAKPSSPVASKDEDDKIRGGIKPPGSTKPSLAELKAKVLSSTTTPAPLTLPVTSASKKTTRTAYTTITAAPSSSPSSLVTKARKKKVKGKRRKNPNGSKLATSSYGKNETTASTAPSERSARINKYPPSRIRIAQDRHDDEPLDLVASAASSYADSGDAEEYEDYSVEED